MINPHVRRLRLLDACAVSDALDKLGLPGVVTGIAQRSGQGRIAGRAVTMKVGPGSPPPGAPVHLGCRAIEAAGADDVIVVSQTSGVEAGCWGGLLTLGAKVKGVAGVIADGPLRDVDEAIAMGFPLWARSLTSRTARGRVVELGAQVPVPVGDVTVHAGDFVLADRSAVIVIAAVDIDRVLDAAETIAAKEAAMAKAIVAGTPIGAVMGGAYEHMLKN